jgi:hypothetical protein
LRIFMEDTLSNDRDDTTLRTDQISIRNPDRLQKSQQMVSPSPDKQRDLEIIRRVFACSEDR